MDETPKQAVIAASLVATAEAEATKIKLHAEEVAKNLLEKATTTAQQISEEQEERAEARVTRALAEALRRIFGENEKSGRFIDVTRIPLICQSIVDMHGSIEEMKQLLKEFDGSHVSQDQFWPIKTFVYGVIGFISISLASTAGWVIFQAITVFPK